MIHVVGNAAVDAHNTGRALSAPGRDDRRPRLDRRSRRQRGQSGDHRRALRRGGPTCRRVGGDAAADRIRRNSGRRARRDRRGARLVGSDRPLRHLLSTATARTRSSASSTRRSISIRSPTAYSRGERSRPATGWCCRATCRRASLAHASVSRRANGAMTALNPSPVYSAARL